jgi:tRNA 5-methylaminomethyl-2-thiouridine biosynthesis bifunctional protein
VKTEAVVAARIQWRDDGLPFAPEFGDVYHPRVGALAQARHVFLRGNELPQRWRRRERFVILETGFGLGNNFLAAWQAWQDDAERCERLVYVGIERYPPTRADLHYAHRASPLPTLATQLLQAWPPQTPDIHALSFDGGRVRLLLAWGDIAAMLRELTLQADAFFLDGFAPARNPAMWTPPLMKALGRRAAPGATAATWSAAQGLRAGLAAAGFEVALAPGIGGKREITTARYHPRFAPRPVTPPIASPVAPPIALHSPQREALVIGAGLAGACTARALVEQGWAVTVLDRHALPAQEGSGNPAGVFHGTVHGDDGAHARVLRAAALAAERLLRPLIERAEVPGQMQGLLRLEAREVDAMRALITRQGLPAEWVQALSRVQAGALAGVTLPGPAWFYPGGGWLAPAALVTHLLHAEGLRFVGDVDVAAVQAAGGLWRALDRSGACVAAAPVLVLAQGAGSAALLSPLGLNLPLQRVRGQLSAWSGPATALALPVAGEGYAVPLGAWGEQGSVLSCGATSDIDDDEPGLRMADHRRNFERLQRLTGLTPPPDTARWTGRVGWRLQADDRQPVAGALPLAQPPAHARRDQARLWPRHPGLYICTALGGRGITLAPLLGQLVAAQISGSPLPLAQSLVDAVDPARWLVRAARRASMAQG